MLLLLLLLCLTGAVLHSVLVRPGLWWYLVSRFLLSQSCSSCCTAVSFKARSHDCVQHCPKICVRFQFLLWMCPVRDRCQPGRADDSKLFHASRLQNVKLRCPVEVCSHGRWSLACIQERKKGNKEYLYGAIYTTQSQSAQTWITQFYLQITSCLPFLRKRSLDGVTPNWGSRHPTAAYYSFTDPEGMKDWVGLVDWPMADGLPT